MELAGIPVLLRFMKEIENHRLGTRVICVPLSNPMGLDSQIMGQQTGYNNLHTNQQNCWNWNRITHLRDEESMEGNWIRTLLELSEDAQVVLDLHTAGWETVPHVYAHRTQVEHAQGLGFPHLLQWETPSASFSDSCFVNGQVALTLELSASRTISQHVIETGMSCLRRFFAMEPAGQESRVWNIENQLKKWYAPKGGVICWQKRAGDDVRMDEPVAALFTRDGEQELKAPCNGVLLLKNPIHAPHERQELAKFLVE